MRHRAGYHQPVAGPHAALRSSGRGASTGRDELSEIVRLGREIYGDDLARFMATPRQSLGNRTPAAVLVRGDLDDVLGILSQAYEGQWG